MARGRKPLGDRAMTDAERQRRRRQNRGEYERVCRLRYRLLSTLDDWVDHNNQPPTISATAILDAIDDLSLFFVLAIKTPDVEEKLALRKRYLNCEALGDLPSIDDLLEQQRIGDLLKRARGL